MIARTLEKKLKQLAKVLPIVALMGPRQSGKTTLVKHVFRGMPYVSLEDLDTRRSAEEDPRGFLSNYRTGAIFDEIQRAPELFSYLQTIVDQKKQTAQFILTGSQNFLLHEKISQTLAGRVSLLKLMPLSLEELNNTSHQLAEADDYIFKGFYPRLYAHSIEPGDWYPNYIQTYVERDVRQMKNIGDLSTFEKFIKLCAGRVGQLLNLSSLATECGITHNTAKAWLSLLEASFIVFLLQPHHKNFNKRLVKMPKLYFYDTGLASSLLGIEKKEQLKTHYLRGNLFENLVISELMKYRLHRGLVPNLYFWRDKVGHEVDCLIEQAEKFIPIEIKAGATALKEYFSHLEYWNALSGQKPGNSFVIYGGAENRKQSFGNLVSWNNILGVLDAIK